MTTSIYSWFEQFAQDALKADFDLIMSIILRTLIVTIIVLFIFRWLGNKGLGQLSTFELIILIGLGSAIGDPMIYLKEMSIPQAITSVLIVVLLFKLFDYLTMKSNRFSRLTIAEPILLAKDGQAIKEGLHQARIDDREYQSYMRLHGLEDLSEIKLSYLEVNGQVSFISKQKD
ncbi:MAG: DUF421 domain-containing protein [Nitrosopumilus sp.]|nr:DUF421 domain-containing protein [Nitrosopumilus sp.]